MMQYLIIMMKGRIVILSNVVTKLVSQYVACTNSFSVWKSKHLRRGHPPSRWRFHSRARPLARFKCQPSIQMFSHESMLQKFARLTYQLTLLCHLESAEEQEA